MTLSSVGRRQMRAALFIVFLGMLAPAGAIACECAKGTYSDGDAAVIFEGEVAEVTGPDSYGVSLIRFKVVETRRGVHSEFITIRVQNHETVSCNPAAAEFKVGDRFLMSAFKLLAVASASVDARTELARKPLYFNHYCGLRQRLPATPVTTLEQAVTEPHVKDHDVSSIR